MNSSFRSPLFSSNAPLSLPRRIVSKKRADRRMQRVIFRALTLALSLPLPPPLFSLSLCFMITFIIIIFVVRSNSSGTAQYARYNIVKYTCSYRVGLSGACEGEGGSGSSAVSPYIYSISRRWRLQRRRRRRFLVTNAFLFPASRFSYFCIFRFSPISHICIRVHTDTFARAFNVEYSLSIRTRSVFITIDTSFDRERKREKKLMRIIITRNKSMRKSHFKNA